VARKKAAITLTSSAATPGRAADKMQVAADGAGLKKGDKPWFLGRLDGVPGPALRLVSEDGVLVLVATATRPLDRRLVRDIETACRWIHSHRPVVDARWRAVLGPNVPPPPTLTIRVVTTAGNTGLEKKLAELPAEVYLQIFALQGNNPRLFPEKLLGADREYLSHPQLAPLLLEARYAASEALRPDLTRDSYDWWSFSEYLVVRTYALLVAAASSLTVICSGLAESKRRGQPSPGSDAFRLRDDLLRVLGVFAERLSKGKFDVEDRRTCRALQNVAGLISKLYGSPGAFDAGAHVTWAWDRPAPQEFHRLLCSGTAGTKPPPVETMLDGLSARSQEVLSDANFGLASATYIGQSFDQVRPGGFSYHSDHEYMQGVQVRVVSNHRILLDLIGVADRFAVLTMLSLVIGICPEQEKQDFAAWVDGPEKHRDFLEGSRLRSLAVIENPGRLSRRGKKRGAALDMAASQEPLIIDALARLLARPRKTLRD